MAAGGGTHLAPVDGLRAICTLSLVAFHTALVCTSFLRPGSGDWARLTGHPAFGLLLGGSLQTDVFLLLGGLLAGRRLRAGPHTSLRAGLAHRALGGGNR